MVLGNEGDDRVVWTTVEKIVIAGVERISVMVDGEMISEEEEDIAITNASTKEKEEEGQTGTPSAPVPTARYMMASERSKDERINVYRTNGRESSVGCGNMYTVLSNEEAGYQDIIV